VSWKRPQTGKRSSPRVRVKRRGPRVTCSVQRVFTITATSSYSSAVFGYNVPCRRGYGRRGIGRKVWWSYTPWATRPLASMFPHSFLPSSLHTCAPFGPRQPTSQLPLRVSCCPVCSRWNTFGVQHLTGEVIGGLISWSIPSGLHASNISGSRHPYSAIVFSPLLYADGLHQHLRPLFLPPLAPFCHWIHHKPIPGRILLAVGHHGHQPASATSRSSTPPCFRPSDALRPSNARPPVKSVLGGGEGVVDKQSG